MKFASLGSGSEGNALLISDASNQTTVMIDCGFGIKETEKRLSRLNKLPSDISAILVTHEHKDHVGGVFKFARRHQIPVWLTSGTYQAVVHDTKDVDIHVCKDGDVLVFNALRLMPFTVPHDAREPVQYTVVEGDIKLGVLTDIGQSTPYVIEQLNGCDALVLECNHDRDMLARSSYPPSVRMRIAGPFGHLSNEASADILTTLDKSRLRLVIAAHISQRNNLSELAYQALSPIVEQVTDCELMIADQEEGFDWQQITATESDRQR